MNYTIHDLEKKIKKILQDNNYPIEEVTLNPSNRPD